MTAPLPLDSVQKPAIKRITRKQMKIRMIPSRWSLVLILVLQALIAEATLHNTAFQDEANYIFAGRQIWQHWLGGPPVGINYSYFISGCPYVYPVIGGGLDLLGGLELVRSFSLLCMLVVTACGYYVTKNLFDQKSAIFAAIFFTCQGPVIFLSRLATYDPLCLCLLALATALAVNASQTQRPWRTLGIGPLLVLAFGAKYAALLFIPSVLAILALCSLYTWGWRRMLARGSLALLSLVGAGVMTALAVIHFDPSMLHALTASTTNRVVAIEYSRLYLTGHVVQMVGISLAIGLAGFVFARQKQLLIALLFLGSALLIPAYHIYKAELVSLDKHLAFSMFFVMPVAGFALASLSGFQPRFRFGAGRHWLAGLAVCLILFLIGTQEAQNMYSSWPPTTKLAYVFNTQVRPASGRYLTDQFEVMRYSLRDDTYYWQWTGLDFFEYTDKQGSLPPSVMKLTSRRLTTATSISSN